jgi:YD repeat-containing protein
MQAIVSVRRTFARTAAWLRRDRVSGVRLFRAGLIKALLVSGIIVMVTFGEAYGANGSVTYTYDALGRVTSASYDTGVVILYSYDANGNRTQQVVNVNTSTLHWDVPATPWSAAVWG